MDDETLAANSNLIWKLDALFLVGQEIQGELPQVLVFRLARHFIVWKLCSHEFI